MTASESSSADVKSAPRGSRKNPIARARIPDELELKQFVKQFGFALHYVDFIKDKKDETGKDFFSPYPRETPNSFTSMERDLLAYQFQYRSKSKTQATLTSYCLRKDPISVAVYLPEDPFDFNSEGEWIRIPPSKMVLQTQVRVSCTEFPQSNIRVWHVVFTPVATFSVYDIIALIHLYDGRSENTEIGEKVKFQVAGNEPSVDVKHLLGRLLPDSGGLAVPAEPSPKGGTIEIICKDDGPIEWMKKLRRSETAAEAGKHNSADKEKFAQDKAENDRRLKPFAGIVTGIFDFDEIGHEELQDTFEPTFPESDMFLKISRCTLICIAQEDRALEACSDSIGISPYLLIPHSVLLHNEFLIENADDNLDESNPAAASVKQILNTLKQRAKDFGEPLKALIRKKGESETAKLRKAADLLATADKYMKSNYLPNVFNYVTERTLYKKGTKIRGVTDMRALVAGKLEDFRNQIGEVQRGRLEGRQTAIASILALTLIGQFDGIFFGEPGKWTHKLLVVVAMLVFLWINLRIRRSGPEREEPHAHGSEGHKNTTP